MEKVPPQYGLIFSPIDVLSRYFIGVYAVLKQLVEEIKPLVEKNKIEEGLNRYLPCLAISF
jgi:hypothetical protein